ncbi:ArsR/SmtB family transcription factor [Pseudonocardia alaniniphila]|uniref:Helix-turn-helix domain-containing protein n=1 Tax=Pseudonocardia alaniniphila TaxID=75291 RepID=A0ABS9TPZ6_9PSEU|nr:helix-turn-helix domain-containing protein [Pseudonocardia alaniniphila]MCH6170606.1 helix-turn-helix domain-containing protein [Pseudonocardia alaniniphila]
MTDQGEPRELTDPAALRALGHPLRQRILRQLHRDGPATSTSLAQVLGENTGATSYHLRQLAEHGFVEEVPERGRGRERWWQARTRDIRFPPRSRMDEEVRAAFDELGRLNVAEDVAAFARFQQQRDSLDEWGDALLFARGALRLTLPQLRQFWEDYMALYGRYAGEADPPADDSRRVLLRFVAFPDVD